MTIMMMSSAERNINKEKSKDKNKTENKNKNKKKKKDRLSDNLIYYVTLRANLHNAWIKKEGGRKKFDKMQKIENEMDEVWDLLSQSEQEIANGICFDIKWAENKGKISDEDLEESVGLPKFRPNILGKLEFLRQYPRTIGNKRIAFFRMKLYKELQLFEVMKIFSDFYEELKEKENNVGL